MKGITQGDLKVRQLFQKNLVRMGTEVSLYGVGYYPRGFINPSAVSEKSLVRMGT
jgi:hypothetical protein